MTQSKNSLIISNIAISQSANSHIESNHFGFLLFGEKFMMKFINSLKHIDITENLDLEKIFITSDLHLFHQNIIDYVKRPFEFSPAGCSQMNEFILQKFDELPEDCLIWNLGDVLLNRKISNDKASFVIWRMKQNRRMNLILGNHDIQNEKEKKQTFIEHYTNLGFDKVFNAPIIFNDKYILSHEPVFIEKGSGYINLHGHTHDRFVQEDFFLSEYNKKYPKKKVAPENYINVCMDANNFQILKLKDLIEL
jgi:calcineurin-like phosphoesterase family protein